MYWWDIIVELLLGAMVQWIYLGSRLDYVSELYVFRIDILLQWSIALLLLFYLLFSEFTTYNRLGSRQIRLQRR